MSGSVIAAIVIMAVILIIGVARAQTPAGKAKAVRYCTKHVIRKSMIPGGPERLVWVYGSHRTQGNACDGPEHRRVTGWW